MLVRYMKQIVDKSEEETQRLLELFAREIEMTCPYKKGREPEDFSGGRNCSDNLH